jgi:outer membrane lipoprotein-sorting protein
MFKTLISTSILALIFPICISAQDINQVVAQVKKKIELVSDYEASGKMKTNVAFLKIPIANVKMYFKRPNKLKLKSEKGVSFIPKGAMSLNMNNLFVENNYTIIDAGTEKMGNTYVRIARLLPNDDNNEIVLSTLYIDPINLVIVKSKTTTRENGTYELEMNYKNYIKFGLPDKILFSFNTKDYKLPKGITFDFDDGASTKKAAIDLKNKKGQAEITITSYIINKGIADVLFN